MRFVSMPFHFATSVTMIRSSQVVLALVGFFSVALLSGNSCHAFTVQGPLARSAPNTASSTAVFFGSFGGGGKKPEEDLSYIESRDMTREEMLEVNRKNEDVMNQELASMTGFSLIISLPVLYLCWVAFFSD